MQKVTLSQKIGLLWLKTFDITGLNHSSLRTLSSFIRLFYYSIFTIVVTFATYASINFILKLSDFSIIMSYFAWGIGLALVLFASGIFFIESLMLIEPKVLREELKKNYRTKMFSFKNLHGGFRIFFYLASLYLVDFLFKIGLIGFVDKEINNNPSLTEVQKIEFTKAALGKISDTEVSFFLVFLICVVAYEYFIYRKKRNIQ